MIWILFHLRSCAFANARGQGSRALQKPHFFSLLFHSPSPVEYMILIEMSNVCWCWNSDFCRLCPCSPGDLYQFPSLRTKRYSPPLGSPKCLLSIRDVSVPIWGASILQDQERKRVCGLDSLGLSDGGWVRSRWARQNVDEEDRDPRKCTVLLMPYTLVVRPA